MVFRRREDVHNAAATGEGAGLFNLRHGLVTEAKQAILERRRIGALPRRQHEHVFAQLRRRRQPLEQGAYGGDDYRIVPGRQVGALPRQQRAEHRNARAEGAGEVGQVFVGQVVEFRVEEHIGWLRRPRAELLVKAVRPVAVGTEHQQRLRRLLLGEGSQYRPRPRAACYLLRTACV